MASTCCDSNPLVPGNTCVCVCVYFEALLGLQHQRGRSALTGWGHSNYQMFVLKYTAITHEITCKILVVVFLFLFFCC